MIEPIWLFLIAFVVIVFILAAILLTRGGSDDINPYDGEGW